MKNKNELQQLCKNVKTEIDALLLHMQTNTNNEEAIKYFKDVRDEVTTYVNNMPEAKVSINASDFGDCEACGS